MKRAHPSLSTRLLAIGALACGATACDDVNATPGETETDPAGGKTDDLSAADDLCPGVSVTQGYQLVHYLNCAETVMADLPSLVPRGTVILLGAFSTRQKLSDAMENYAGADPIPDDALYIPVPDWHELSRNLAFRFPEGGEYQVEYPFGSVVESCFRGTSSYPYWAVRHITKMTPGVVDASAPYTQTIATEFCQDHQRNKLFVEIIAL